MRNFILLSVFATLLLVPCHNVFAGDAATIIFREGHVAYVANGYAVLADEYKKLSATEDTHRIVELKLESSPFMIDLAQVVVICRDKCTSLEVKDPRQTETKK